MSLVFRHFVSNCDYMDYNIAVYGDTENEESRVLIAQKNQEEISKKEISRCEYRALQDQWTDGGKIQDGDAIITLSALEYFGIF